LLMSGGFPMFSFLWLRVTSLHRLETEAHPTTPETEACFSSKALQIQYIPGRAFCAPIWPGHVSVISWHFDFRFSFLCILHHFAHSSHSSPEMWMWIQLNLLTGGSPCIVVGILARGMLHEYFCWLKDA